VNAEPEPRPDRREVLGGIVGTLGLGFLATLAGCVNEARTARIARAPRPAPGPRTLSGAEHTTLEAALDVMLPSGPGSPGARDVRAADYLDAALTDPDTDPSVVARVRDGARRLDEAARRDGARDFADAPADARERAMRAVAATDDGPAFVLAALMFGLEALLGDPVHGGNPGEIGWTWLGHAPGDPRPTRKAVERGR
jgi:hypothetical protein